MSTLTEARDAWCEARDELTSSTPWTADWLRARMIEADLRLAYLALLSDDPEESPDDPVIPSRDPLRTG